MPFWWRRRKRYWFRRQPYKRYRKKWWRKPHQKRRRRTRRLTRRRRRRRKYKVRRKKKTIPIRQWQPDSIVNCKIKGVTTIVLGGEGKQLVCYTNVKKAWTPAKAPGGGGFGCEQFSLSSLYEQYVFRKNVWTKTNINKDLCRYLRAKLTFYRHPETDFIVNYSRQPPFDLTKEQYTACHPLNMLLSRHKILILSRSTKPNGKLKHTKIIKPPKQMITKWFFQEYFAPEPLLLVSAAACNFNYTNLGCCNVNQISTFFYLNTGFYKQANWDIAGGQYKPYPTISLPLYFWSEKDFNTTTVTEPTFTMNTTQYPNETTSWDKGWFTSKILTAYAVTKEKNKTSFLGNIPVNTCRYNPNLDNGKNSRIWLVSTLQNDYHKPSRDKTLIYEGLPLYMMLYGWLSYVQAVKKAQDFFLSYILCMESDALKPASQLGAEGPIVPLDNTFVNGKPPYGEPITQAQKAHWTPNLYNQLEILNTIVESGPLVPKYSRTTNSTWELDCHYNFLFKWGGPEVTEPPITDPHLQGIYEVPDTIKAAIQIRDPRKQKPNTLLHPWDIRRGYFTTTALKRMSDNLSIDTTFQPDAEEVPRKKKKTTGPELTVPQEETEEIQNCLLSLCEESTFQAQEENNLLNLIKEQHRKQQDLKYNLLRVLSELKEKQNLLRLQTGMFH